MLLWINRVLRGDEDETDEVNASQWRRMEGLPPGRHKRDPDRWRSSW